MVRTSVHFLFCFVDSIVVMLQLIKITSTSLFSKKGKYCSLLDCHYAPNCTSNLAFTQYFNQMYHTDHQHCRTTTLPIVSECLPELQTTRQKYTEYRTLPVSATAAGIAGKGRTSPAKHVSRESCRAMISETVSSSSASSLRECLETLCFSGASPSTPVTVPRGRRATSISSCSTPRPESTSWSSPPKTTSGATLAKSPGSTKENSIWSLRWSAVPLRN
mmetsp:Transcript_22675/g.48107  ORF Transcript_22675/g.48107 Transcript_22675/m.48107 type:complete len:219 (+) Transcript_22675:1847-2503(+)